jgi:hypothetical protein
VSGRPRGWPIDHPFAPNRACQVGGDSPLPLYKRPLQLKTQQHTLLVGTCKGFGLVVVAQAKPC